MILQIFDDCIEEPEEYVEEIRAGEFVDVVDGDQVFKNLQARGRDEFQETMEELYPRHEVLYNFVRCSPLGQHEPNFIHEDSMMGEKIAILYLNQAFPEEDGTTIYNEDETPMIVVKARYNRLIVFDTHLLHGRNIEENYGEGDSSRLIQVIFLGTSNEE